MFGALYMYIFEDPLTRHSLVLRKQSNNLIPGEHSDQVRTVTKYRGVLLEFVLQRMYESMLP